MEGGDGDTKVIRMAGELSRTSLITLSLVQGFKNPNDGQKLQRSFLKRALCPGLAPHVLIRTSRGEAQDSDAPIRSSNHS